MWLILIGATVTELIYTVIVLVGFLTITTWATCLLLKRLKAKERPSRSFREWLRHIFEGVMGL